jgi:hypothetical protein
MTRRSVLGNVPSKDQTLYSDESALQPPADSIPASRTEKPSITLIANKVAAGKEPTEQGTTGPNNGLELESRGLRRPRNFGDMDRGDSASGCAGECRRYRSRLAGIATDQRVMY